jgi:hypothetical protein
MAAESVYPRARGDLVSAGLIPTTGRVYPRARGDLAGVCNEVTPTWGREGVTRRLPTQGRAALDMGRDTGIRALIRFPHSTRVTGVGLEKFAATNWRLMLRAVAQGITRDQGT